MRLQATKKTPAGIEIVVNAKSQDHLNFMLASDIHLDSVASDYNLFESHLKQAEELQAPVLINGDLFDAMQGRYDPRRSPEKLKKEFRVSSYFDALVLWHAHQLKKFKNIPLLIIGKGNHETSVTKNVGTDLVERLVHDLRLNGVNAIAAGYWGYIRIKFAYKKGTQSASTRIYFHHGKSSNAQVTRGVIQTNRQGVYVKDAELVHNGHLHDAYAMPIKVERLNQKTLATRTEVQWYVRTPGYVYSKADMMEMTGYVPERHPAPKPRGCAFVRYNYQNGDPTIDIEVTQKIK